MTQKTHTMPKRFRRSPNSNTSNPTPTSNASTHNPEVSTFDFDREYFISESEMDNPLFDDGEAIIVVEEDEVSPTTNTPSPKSPQVVDASRSIKNTPTHTQTSKAKAQAVPPLPPNRNKGKMDKVDFSHLVGGMGDIESSSRNAVDSNQNLSQTRSENSTMGGRSHHQVESTRTQSSQAKVVAKSKPKQKRYRAKEFTANDLQLLETVHWMGRATINHLIYASSLSPAYVHKRLKQLHERGYLKPSNPDELNKAITLYALTREGLDRIGQGNEKVVGAYALSTYRHRNQINSTVLQFKMGINPWVAKRFQLDIEHMKQVERNNRKAETHNGLLAFKQDSIKAKPEQERTVKDWEVLALQPNRVNPVVVPNERMLKHDIRDFRAHPNAVFPEKFIERAINENGEQYCSLAWDTECDNWLGNDTYPVKALGDDTVTNDDIQAMYSVVDGNEWIFRHWNSSGKFKARHQPDGVVLLPHQVDSQGRVHPMSWWIEVEANRKSDTSEVERVILQAFDSPVVRGVLYITTDSAVRNSVLKARNNVIKKLSYDYEMRGATPEQAHREATLFVENNCRIHKPQLVYPNQPESFWG